MNKIMIAAIAIGMLGLYNHGFFSETLTVAREIAEAMSATE